MKFKQFTKVAAMSILAIAITACTEKPDNSFHKNLDLGYYNGMHVTWVKDDAETKATGFYIIDDTKIDKNQHNNSDFDSEKLVGHYGDLDIMWVADHTDANSKGFYIFKNKENQIVPSLSIGEKFKSGKSTVTKNVGVVFTSSLNNPNLQVKLDDKAYEETVKVSELSSSELIQLSQRLLEVAKQKDLENTNNTFTAKPRF